MPPSGFGAGGGVSVGVGDTGAEVDSRSSIGEENVFSESEAGVSARSIVDDASAI